MLPTPASTRRLRNPIPEKAGQDVAQRSVRVSRALRKNQEDTAQTGYDDARSANVATPASEGLIARHGRREIQPGPPRPRSGPTNPDLAGTLRLKPMADGGQSSTVATSSHAWRAGGGRPEARRGAKRRRRDRTLRRPRPRPEPVPPRFNAARKGPPRQASKHAEKRSSAGGGTAQALPGANGGGRGGGGGGGSWLGRRGRPSRLGVATGAINGGPSRHLIKL